MKLKLFLIIGFVLHLSNKTQAQKISFDPVDWKPDQPVTIKIDYTATSFQGVA